MLRPSDQPLYQDDEAYLLQHNVANILLRLTETLLRLRRATGLSQRDMENIILGNHEKDHPEFGPATCGEIITSRAEGQEILD
jgi:hypothetical protein